MMEGGVHLHGSGLVWTRIQPVENPHTSIGAVCLEKVCLEKSVSCSVPFPMLRGEMPREVPVSLAKETN